MKKLDKRKYKINNGITLIALVITIIILLILAGVAIATLTGENGILNKASEASENTKQANAEEQVKLAILASRGTDGKIDMASLNNELEKIGAYFKENPISSDNQIETLPAIVTLDGYEVEITGDVSDSHPPIPDGFYHVEGTTIEDGYVISDQEGDDLDNTAKGNQFVWVPVENFSEFVRRDGYSNGSVQNYVSKLTCTEADMTGINSKVEETSKTKTEAQEMYKSVEKNKGFYIGRYETGKENNNVVIQKGANPYCVVKWSSNGEMQETTGTTGGAVELSRNFTNNKGYTNAVSTLIYGVQWDATMKWMENVENPNVTGDFTKYIQNSTGMGWYRDNYSKNPSHLTGQDVDANKSNCIKNVYDLGGNLYEWTMESYDTDKRVIRGCGYTDGGYFPASIRSYSKPSEGTSYTGFRIALYIKDR